MITVIQLLGGKGTRLSEITKGNIPKPLVKLKGVQSIDFEDKFFFTVLEYL